MRAMRLPQSPAWMTSTRERMVMDKLSMDQARTRKKMQPMRVNPHLKIVLSNNCYLPLNHRESIFNNDAHQMAITTATQLKKKQMKKFSLLSLILLSAILVQAQSYDNIKNRLVLQQAKQAKEELDKSMG